MSIVASRVVTANTDVLSVAVGSLLNAGRDLHLFHLMTDVYAVHVVLKDIYELCIESGDRLAEEALGSGTRLNPSVTQSAAVSGRDPCTYVFSLMQALEACRLRLDQSSAHANTLADISGRLQQQNFLLRMASTETIKV